MFNFLVVLLLQARWAVPAGGAVALEGPWRFRAGDSLAWMSPAYNDGRWTLSTLAAPWSYRSAPRTRGFVWFRGWLTLAAVPDAQLGAILRTDGMAFEIYVDGVRIGGVGGFPPDYRARTVLPVPFAIPLASLAPGPHLVAIRTYSTELRVVPPAPLVVAPLADLLGQVRREDLYMFGAAVLFLGLAAYQLFFWARRREAREHLYVFLFCGTLALLFLNWMPSVRLALSPTVDWFRLYLAFGATAAAMLALGARGIFDIEPDSLAARGTAALGVVYGLLVPLAFLLPEWSALRWMEQYVFNVGVAAGAVVLVVLSAAARRRDLPYGTTLLAGSFALAMAAAHDVALSWGWIPGEWGGATIVTQYGAVAFVLSVALATAGRFADTQTTALYDRLTGLYRREVVMDALAREIRRAARIHQPLTVLMLDIDHFKVVNDSLGHQGGDRVLGEVGRRLADAGRVVDWVGRYGGEEFLAVLAGTGGAGAHLAAERFRTAVSALPIGAGRAARTVTLSAGIAAYDGGEEWPTSEQLVGAADAALYRAKNAGRNCTSD
ncbi:MAG TPA: diguanylate cyclase [Gemmatimonadales bacterium]|nr:diguanylate cyclase [Gemmatimonadales bacterium]